MEPAMMTGLELLTAVAAGEIAPAPMAGIIPMTSMEITETVVKIIARADERHLNPFGGIHGGFAATVLDSVTGCAVQSKLAAGISFVTTDLHITMMRPVPLDEDLIAEGHATHVSNNIATAHGTLKSADGKLLVSAVATFFIRPRR